MNWGKRPEFKVVPKQQWASSCVLYSSHLLSPTLDSRAAQNEETTVQTEALQEKSYSSQRSKKENSQGSERVEKNPFLKSSFHSFSVDTSGKPTVPWRVTAVASGQAYKIVRKRALIIGPVVPRVQDEFQTFFFFSLSLSLWPFTTWCLIKDIIIGYAWQSRETKALVLASGWEGKGTARELESIGEFLKRCRRELTRDSIKRCLDLTLNSIPRLWELNYRTDYHLVLKLAIGWCIERQGPSTTTKTPKT